MLTAHDWNMAARRLLNNIENDTRELADSSYEIPVSHYSDKERWNREFDLVIKRQPVILALSCELTQPNSYRAISRAGVPILLTRAADGKARGFINACRHRGALLTGDAEKCGIAKRFSCPYHAWTFDSKGALTAIPARDQFGEVPDEYHRLIPIEVQEKAGLIWGILTPGLTFDLDEYLGDMLPMLEKLDLGSFHFGREAFMAGPNWKLTLDGYIENYHFNVLHKNTFGKIMLHDFTAYDVVGPHTRYLVPGAQIRNLRDIPESQWRASGHLMYSFNIFPNVALGLIPNENPQDQMFVMAQIWPGEAPDVSVTRQVIAMPRALAESDQEAIRQVMDANIAVLESEDYWAVRGQQAGLDAMGNEKFIYGRMERMVQTFEKNVNAIVDKSNA